MSYFEECLIIEQIRGPRSGFKNNLNVELTEIVQFQWESFYLRICRFHGGYVMSKISLTSNLNAQAVRGLIEYWGRSVTDRMDAFRSLGIRGTVAVTGSADKRECKHTAEAAVTSVQLSLFYC
jgi:hypothetical protein